MADQMRWRYGDTNPVITKPIASGTEVDIGDLVEMNTSGDVTPAASHTWTTDLPTTQDSFQNTFLGVATQRSRVGDSFPIRVATTGVFEFDCSPATFELGTLVAPDKQTGNALQNQQVVALTSGNEAKAIGRVAKRYPTNTTQVLVEVFSTIMRGGVQPKP